MILNTVYEFLRMLQSDPHRNAFRFKSDSTVPEHFVDIACGVSGSEYDRPVKTGAIRCPYAGHSAVFHHKSINFMVEKHFSS